MNASATAFVEQWLHVRKRLEIARSRPLFCTVSNRYGRGQPLYDCYVRTMLSRLASRAAIEKRVHPHGLRHSHAVQLVEKGIPVNLIQAQLGHSSLAVTGEDLNSIAPAERVRRIRDLEW